MARGRSAGARTRRPRTSSAINRRAGSRTPPPHFRPPPAATVQTLRLRSALKRLRQAAPRRGKSKKARVTISNPRRHHDAKLNRGIPLPVPGIFGAFTTVDSTIRTQIETRHAVDVLLICQWSNTPWRVFCWNDTGGATSTDKVLAADNPQFDPPSQVRPMRMSLRLRSTTYSGQCAGVVRILSVPEAPNWYTNGAFNPQNHDVPFIGQAFKDSLVDFVKQDNRTVLFASGIRNALYMRAPHHTDP